MKRSGLPKGVTMFFDRHGKRRIRGRRNGLTYYFQSELGTEQWVLEYQRWQAGLKPHGEIGAKRTKPGSVSALVVKLYRSAEWVNLSEATKTTYRGIIERFRAEHCDKPVAQLERKHVRDIVAKKAQTPAAANNLLRMIRMLMRFAIDEEWRRDDPTIGVKTIRAKSDGFHTWTEDEISTFEKRWPVGTRERALSEQNSKYLERPSNRSDRPGKTQENQWPRNPVLTFWQSKRICSDNASSGAAGDGEGWTRSPPGTPRPVPRKVR
jgi:hypothetical protein